MRIDKFLSECGRMTRSEAAKAARRGEIAVNGKTVRKSDVHIDPETDELTLCGEKIPYRKYVYIMLNKPAGYVSATEAPGDRCVTELLGDEYSKLGLFPCGRLDRDTVGLMLLTNDGELSHMLLSPKRHVDKVYRFTCADALTDEDAAKLESGIELADGYKTKKSRVRLGRDRMSGEITLTEGKYHQIKRMFGALCNKITSLERISFGNLKLDNTLERGRFRELTPAELKSLKALSIIKRDSDTHTFRGKWITSEEFCALKPLNVFHRQLEKTELKPFGPQDAHILFRAGFDIQKIDNTVIYISADDYYKLYINGVFVSQGPAAGYSFHYYYNEIDITDYLHEGENIVAVHTYYQGLINRVWVSGDDRHGLIFDVESAGKSVLFSDERTKYSFHKGYEAIGEFGYHTQFAQRYTSGTESEHFFDALYDDSAWKNAKLREYIDYCLFRQPTEQLVFEKIMPVEKWDDEGVTLDFGSTYAGYLCVSACGEKGSVVELLFGQELDEFGKVRWKLRAGCDYREEWVLSGEHDRLDEFDYKSFRYARINLPKGCKLNEISLCARHYPFVLAAKPAVKDEKLLKIWDLCVHTLKYGVQEVIQDCLEREKGNYLGDGCYTALAYAILTGDSAQLKKLTDDSMRSSFINEGLVTCAACSFMQEIAEFPLYMFEMLYSYYRLTGDAEYLKEKYDGLCRILDYYRQSYMNSDGLLTNLDKWCVVEWPQNYRDGYDADITEGKICTDVHSVINAHYIGAAANLNRIAAIIDRPPYCDEQPLRKAFIDAFYVPEKKLFKDNVKSEHISFVSNAYALMYGLAPNPEADESMVDFIKSKGFTCGMLFASYAVLSGLKRLGKKELMYEFVSDENAWLRMLREGATTTFEGWGKDSKWNTSLFHLTLSYAVIFLTDWEKHE